MKTPALAATIALTGTLMLAGCAPSTPNAPGEITKTPTTDTSEAISGAQTIDQTTYQEATSGYVTDFLAGIGENQAVQLSVTADFFEGTAQDTYSFNPDGSVVVTSTDEGSASGTLACFTGGDCFFKLPAGDWQTDGSLNDVPTAEKTLNQYLNLLDGAGTIYSENDGTYSASITQGGDEATISVSAPTDTFTITQTGSTGFSLTAQAAASEPVTVDENQVRQQASEQDTPETIGQDTP